MATKIWQSQELAQLAQIRAVTIANGTRWHQAKITVGRRINFQFKENKHQQNCGDEKWEKSDRAKFRERDDAVGSKQPIIGSANWSKKIKNRKTRM